MGDPIAIDQALTLADRTAHAAAFRAAFHPLLNDWTIAVDDPQDASITQDGIAAEGGDAFDRAYAAWPTRFYVLSAPGEDVPVRLVWKAEPADDNEYKLQTLEDFLRRTKELTSL